LQRKLSVEVRAVPHPDGFEPEIVVREPIANGVRSRFFPVGVMFVTEGRAEDYGRTMVPEIIPRE